MGLNKNFPNGPSATEIFWKEYADVNNFFLMNSQVWLLVVLKTLPVTALSEG